MTFTWMNIKLDVKYDLATNKLSIQKYLSNTIIIDDYRIQLSTYDGDWLTIITKCWTWNEDDIDDVD